MNYLSTPPPALASAYVRLMDAVVAAHGARTAAGCLICVALAEINKLEKGE